MHAGKIVYLLGPTEFSQFKTFLERGLLHVWQNFPGIIFLDRIILTKFSVKNFLVIPSHVSVKRHLPTKILYEQVEIIKDVWIERSGRKVENVHNELYNRNGWWTLEISSPGILFNMAIIVLVGNKQTRFPIYTLVNVDTTIRSFFLKLLKWIGTENGSDGLYMGSKDFLVQGFEVTPRQHHFFLPVKKLHWKVGWKSKCPLSPSEGKLLLNEFKWLCYPARLTQDYDFTRQPWIMGFKIFQRSWQWCTSLERCWCFDAIQWRYSGITNSDLLIYL